MSAKVYDAINAQVTNELAASHSYLALSARCEELNFPGAAHWFRVQSEEERGHALRLFDFIHARNHAVSLQPIPFGGSTATSLLDVFKASLAQEEHVSEQINELYDVAMQEKDFAAVVELQWFVTEQVEEEKSVRDIIARLEMAGDDAPALLEIDRELSGRTGEADGAADGDS